MASVDAAIIDFETLPSGASSIDNTLLGLNDAYSISGVDVTFGFDTDGDGITDTQGVIEKVGDADSDGGFLNDTLGQSDTAAPGFESQLGDFFYRTQTFSGFGTFIIDYTSSAPVTAASGEIWDIDGSTNNTEQFQIQAFDIGNNLLDTIISPLGNNLTLDGKPFTFSFSGLSNIDQIRIEFVGNKTQFIGLAFNNFSPITAIPVPAALWLFASAVGLLGWVKRRAV